MARKQAAPEAVDPWADAPIYDPTVHTDPDLMVLGRAGCSCGRRRSQYDPVHIVAEALGEWQARHTGEGHSPVDYDQVEG